MSKLGFVIRGQMMMCLMEPKNVGGSQNFYARYAAYKPPGSRYAVYFGDLFTLRESFPLTEGISRVGRADASHFMILLAMASPPFLLISHSQMIATLQPNLRNAAKLRLSRFTVPLNFASQNSTFDEGVVANLQVSCLCQKHP